MASVLEVSSEMTRPTIRAELELYNYYKTSENAA